MTLITNLPLQTAAGAPVELVTAKGRDADYPLMGYIGDAQGISAWSPLGYCDSGSPSDRLVNAPVTGTVYVVAYFDINGRRQHSYTDASTAREAFEQLLEVSSYSGLTLIALPFSAPVGQNGLAIDPHPEPK